MAERVLVLDDDADLLEVLTEFVTVLCGGVCVAVASFVAMVAREGEVLACEVALLDINLGPGKPSGIEAFRWLKAKSFAGRVYFFTGHAAKHPLVVEAQKLGHVQILTKPIESKTLVEVVRCGSKER